MADRQTDHVGFDVFERAQVAVGGVEHHAHALLDHRVVLLLAAEQAGEVREILRGQRVAVAEHRGTEQHRLQLADVARPVVGREQLERAVGDPQRAQPRLVADPGEKMAGQRGQIAGPFAQRRQYHLGHGQRGGQLRPVIAMLDQFGQRGVARREQPHVDPETVPRADRLNLPGSEVDGEPFLHRQRHPVDLVEHQRRAVGLLECADMAVERPGERAFFMPEQHRFDLIGGNPADVDETQTGLGARAGGVHRAH